MILPTNNKSVRISEFSKENIELSIHAGKLYIFSGFQTIHGNSPCSPNSPRATVLFHYADPFSQNLCFKLVERLNDEYRSAIRRINNDQM